MHFAAAIDKELYEFLKQTGGDCHTVDIEGNNPEWVSALGFVFL